MNYAPQSLLRPKQLYFDLYYILVSNLPRKEPYGFFLADTILFLENAPILWLFTSKKDMSIKRKNTSRLNMKNILEKISSFESNDIVAYYMNSGDNEYKDPVKTYPNKDESDKNSLLIDFLDKFGVETENISKMFKKSLLLFEYFTREELKEFLLNKKKKQGVLQFYIKQTTNINIMSRIIYNDKIAICDVRRARQPENKKTPHFYEKIITFETDKFHIISENVKSKLLESVLKNAARQIIKRIELFYRGKIKINSIILHFKEGADKLIYLQFCTGISFIEYEDDKKKLALWLGHEFKCELNESFLTSIYKSSYIEKDKKNITTERCINCNKFSIHDNFYEIPISYIIDYHNKFRSLPVSSQIDIEQNDITSCVKAIVIKEFKEQIQELEEKDDIHKNNIGLKRSEMSDVPVALKRLELDLKRGDVNGDIYRHMKNPQFKNTKIKVCGDCYPKLIHFDMKEGKKSLYNNLVLPIKKINNNKFIVKRDVLNDRLNRNVKSYNEEALFKMTNRSSSLNVKIPMIKQEKSSSRSILQHSFKKLLNKNVTKETDQYDSNRSINTSHFKRNSFKLPLDKILNLKKDETRLSLSNRTISMNYTSKSTARSSGKSLFKCTMKI